MHTKPITHTREEGLYKTLNKRPDPKKNPNPETQVGAESSEKPVKRQSVQNFPAASGTP